ncbi:MAG: hypothetical protein ACJ79O_14290 [Myxococcales bacterium]
MPNVRLVARPDPHMVEVPLELDAELPREFEGSALLASTGLPRKVRLKAQRDQLKLSTAYRADQLLADIVRVAMQATPRDLERVQAAARAFLRAVRERRQDGASLRIESGERGRIEIIESMPQGSARAPRSLPPPPPGEGAGIRPAAQPERASPGFEQRFAEMEAKLARLLPLADTIGRLEERISRAESRIAELESRPVGPSTSPIEGQRGLLRRATAVDAYADGLRKELHASISTELEKAVVATSRLDHAAGLALEAERTLGEAAVQHSDALRAASAEATAREEGLRRLQEEVDLYSGGDIPLAERLVSRFREGQKPLEAAGPLEALAKALAVAPGPEEDLSKWLRRAAPLCGWTFIEPSANDPVDAELHEAREPGEPGEIVQRVLVPGVKRSDGSLLLRARIVAAARGAESAARSTVESLSAPSQ